MTWHIIGSSSYIASRLMPVIPAGETVIRYARQPNADERKLDLTVFCESDLEKIRSGDFVVLLAAISSPDFCRDHEAEAYAINVTGTENFIRACLSRGARVLFFSSDVVVGATETVHDETMPVSPVGNYGSMKRAVERAFAGDPRFKVFRLSYVFSRQDKFLRYLASCVEKGETADVFQALYRNVVYLGDVLSAVIALGKSFDCWENSIFHLSGPELLCRADMAMCYQKISMSELSYTVSIPDARFFEARPNVIETRSLYLQDLLGHPATALEKAMQIEFSNTKES
ncbi:MAG: sugar nucleotide-binding protein [Intestinimonas sp.]|jgi:dTDP-4-dehydrorhamnose reductase|nr:sugar nucleotide-binding protein [Intestinimonas sp.]